MPKHIMVAAEQRDGTIANVSLELLGIARELAPDGCIVSAVICGSELGKQPGLLAGHGADKVFVLDDFCFKKYTTDAYAQGMYGIILREKPDVVLFGATSIGRDLAPRLSARLNTGLTADCTKLELDGEGNLLMTRPAFSGNLFATIICPEHRPQMSTVRPGVMRKLPFDANRTAEIIAEKTHHIVTTAGVKIISETLSERREENIEDTKVLISMGRGASSPETVACAKRIAKILGGEVSSSRALVDEGIMPSARQVGQTGKTVRPIIYMANGISGAVQHVAGMEEAEYIIAINSDPDAPIFSVSHLGIVGDANKILPLIEQRLKARNTEI